jgi:exosortase/archaeosortase family protein
LFSFVAENQYRSLNIFLLKIFLLYFIWLISDSFLSHKISWFGSIWAYFYHIFLNIVLTGSKWGLSLLGYDFVSGYNSLAILGSYGVIIGNQCVGFGLSYGFVALIGAYPGPIKKKLWFIPLGILLISSINIARVIALATSVYKTGGFVQMEEHDLFNNIIYFFIFLMWIIWVKLINKNQL